jgi:predicted nuclease with RNAse H fold
MIIVGIDLAGPANAADTALAAFEVGHHSAGLLHARIGLTDADIFSILAELSDLGPLVAGLDAPLSYQPGGGDREGDSRLRSLIQTAGLSAGAVMPPTLTRMVYLTVRGMSVARSLAQLPDPPRVVEVHPGAAMVLRGAPVTAVRAMKKDSASRATLLSWLATQHLNGLENISNPSDHLIAALAAALASWQWAINRPVWVQPAQPPYHPFDYAA